MYAPINLFIYFLFFGLFQEQLSGRGMWTYSISLAIAVILG